MKRSLRGSLSAGVLTLAIVLVLFGFVFVLLRSGQQAPGIEAKQQTNSARKGDGATGQPNGSSDSTIAASPSGRASNHREKADSNGSESAQEGTEFWTPVTGYRLKITDTLLAVFTFLLVIIGAWQGRQLQRTVTATRDLAQATIDLELPKLRILDASLGPGAQSPETEATRLHAPEVTVIVGNFGNTPAFFKNWLINVTVAESLPHPPAFRGIVRLERDLQMPVLAKGEKASLTEREFGEREYTRERITAMLANMTDDRFFVYGIIEFEDYEGREYERGFALVWSESTELVPEGFLTWEQKGYNYQRRKQQEPDILIRLN